MKIRERFFFGMPTMLFCFAVILLDSKGTIDVGKWGYAFIASLITLIINFYYRKTTKAEETLPDKPPDGTG